jgi:Protein of unknown function (DUF3006)
VTSRLSLDRFEGKNKSIAVLLTDDGDSISFPKVLLPAGAKAGDVLSLTLERDDEATRELAEQTRAVQKDLRKTDPGGDIKL